jgi:cytochrome c peroxidase
LEDVEAGNELAAIDDSDFIGIWNALMARLMANEEYRQMFANAFPEVPESSLGFQHAAIAIAAFEAEAFGMNDSPFDQYLAGDREALSHDAKRGAALFYGAAKCVSCHSGTLLTDQQHHNLAVPQLGPGKDPTSGLDFGRFGVTGSMSDLFEFRTPPLRNVTATGPWMHNGAFSSLEDVIRHHGDVGKSLEDYDPSVQIFQSDLREMVVDDESLNEWMLETVDTGDQDFDGNRVHFLMAFLESLTVPNLHERLQWVIPADVPSGLLEDGIPEVD